MRNFLILLAAVLFTPPTFASASRIVTADQFQSSDLTKTWTPPSVSDTLIGVAATQTLTNKTISGASNTFTAIPTSAIAGGNLSGVNTGDITLGTANGLSLLAQVLSLQAADATHTGALLNTDWVIFDNKFNLPSLTSGSVLFSNGTTIAQDNANFFWDNTNKNLTVTSPTNAAGYALTAASDLGGVFGNGRMLNLFGNPGGGGWISRSDGGLDKSWIEILGGHDETTGGTFYINGNNSTNGDAGGIQAIMGLPGSSFDVYDHTVSNLRFSVLDTGATFIGGPIEQIQSTTPTNPAAGNDKLYFKSDDRLYSLNSAGSEALIGPLTANMNYLGTWSNVTNYLVNDVVTFQGVGYICIANNHSGAPDNNPLLWAQLGFPVLDAVTNGVVTSAPTQNAVFNAIATSAGAKWSLSGNAGTAGTAVVGTTDAQQWSTVANGIFVDAYQPDGSVSSIENITAVDGTNFIQKRNQVNLNATATTIAANFSNQNNSVGYGGSGFDYGGSIVSISNGVSHGGTENINFMGAASNNAFFTGGGHTGTVKNNDSNTNISGPYTIDSFIGSSSYVNANQLTGSVTGFDTGNNIASSTIVNANAFNGNMDVNGASVVSGGVFGFNQNAQVRDTASTQFLNGANFGTNLSNTAHANDIQGIQQNLQISDATTVTNGSVGINDGITVRNTASAGYINALQANIQIQDSPTITNINGISPNINTNNSPSIQSITVYNDSSTINGATTIANGFTEMGLYGQLTGTSTASNFTGLQISPQIAGSASVTNFQPFQLQANVQNTATVTNGVTLAQMSLASTPAIPSATGLNINITGANVADATQKTAINAQGGINTFGYDFTIPPAATFLGVNQFNNQMTVANGAPISSLGFINNYGANVIMHDDWTADFTGIRIGFAPISVIAQVAIDAGKTMDSYSGVLSGLNDVGGAGTIDQAANFRAAGVIPGGGGVTTNREIGFEAMPTMCGTSAGNCWAFRDNSSAENYLGKLAIGTGSKKVTSGFLLDVNGDALLELPITMTQATTPANPAAGRNKLYFKSDDKLYGLNSAGVEVLVGPGAGGGGFSRSVSTVAVNTVISTLTTDNIFNVDTTGGAINITLPDSVASNSWCVDVKNIGANPITVDAFGGQTIDGSATDPITLAMHSHRYCAVNGNWFNY